MPKDYWQQFIGLRPWIDRSQREGLPRHNLEAEYGERYVFDLHVEQTRTGCRQCSEMIKQS
jgi:hypothetical protein